MPYINITETDITPMSSFDTIENAVLIFGYDFSQDFNSTEEYKEERGARLENRPYTLYTSLLEFIKDMKASGIIIDDAARRTPAFRPYVTAYDCLSSGLPVIFMPMDDCLDSEAIINRPAYDSEGESSAQEAKDFVVYNWLSNKDAVPEVPEDDAEFASSIWAKTYLFRKKEDAESQYEKLHSDENNYAEKTLDAFITKLIDNEPYLLSDRVNMPFTFITTCGYEAYTGEPIWNRIASLSGANATKPLRKDFIYLYDLKAETKPKDIIETDLNISEPRTLVNIVYPWCHFNSYTNTPGIHMPGSYAYLMAYANSIRNNKPWLAVAGVNRGVIPNIVSIDYDIQEAYIHSFQGDYEDSDGASSSGQVNVKNGRINPIINLGANYGKIIFGNRTCDIINANDVNFSGFLNIRLLLTYLHKQAFNSSMTHMFEPNDDIVWLSFKQKVNNLLDQMVTGRGIKWYKWYKLRPDRLGQIKAKLVIRPIEAIEAFDINITMTDQDIEVVEEVR